VSSHILQLFCPGLYHHSLLRQSIAGCRIVIKALYRDDAQLAGAYGLQVRVVAKCRHIRSSFANRIENGSPLRDRYLSIIDDQSEFKHVQPRRTMMRINCIRRLL
jgi:hypothetical protein